MMLRATLTPRLAGHLAALCCAAYCCACGSAGSAHTPAGHRSATDASGEANADGATGWVIEDITLTTGGSREGERADAAVQARRQGKHTRLPGLVKVGDGERPDAWPVVEISNQAEHGLVVWFSGPCSRVITVEPKGKQGAELCAGPYEVAAELAAPDFLPFVGSGETLENGQNYALTFFILRHPKQVRRKTSASRGD